MIAARSKFDVAYRSSLNGWLVNGRRPDTGLSPEDDDYDDIEQMGPVCEELDRRTNTDDIEKWSTKDCPFCDLPFCLTKSDDPDANADEERSWLGRRYRFLRCLRCGHWEFLGSETTDQCMDDACSILVQSVAAKFDPSLPTACAQELAQELRRRPDAWHMVNPRRMELFVADIFRANHRHSEVIHVGRRGDGGKDVIFIDDNSIRWLIQVKRRERPQPSERFDTIQSILGTLALEGERHGIVVSTRTAFSQGARAALRTAAKRGYTIQLIDRGILDRLLDPLVPRVPWSELFSSPYLEHIPQSVRHDLSYGESEVSDRQLLLFS